MQRIALIALLALALAACGSREKPAEIESPARPLQDYWTWSDPGIAQGNFDADYADCKSQVESDPAINASTPKLAVLATYMKCMQPKGWKFINPDAPQP